MEGDGGKSETTMIATIPKQDLNYKRLRGTLILYDNLKKKNVQNMQVFGVSPFFKRPNNSLTTMVKNKSVFNQFQLWHVPSVWKNIFPKIQNTPQLKPDEFFNCCFVA